MYVGSEFNVWRGFFLLGSSFQVPLASSACKCANSCMIITRKCRNIIRVIPKLKWGFPSRVGRLWFVIACFVYKINTFISFHLWWCMLEVGVEFEWRAGNYFVRLIEAKLIIIGSFWHTKMSLFLSMNCYRILSSNLHTTATSKNAPKTYRTWEVLYAKQRTPDQKSCWVRG